MQNVGVFKGKTSNAYVDFTRPYDVTNKPKVEKSDDIKMNKLSLGDFHILMCNNTESLKIAQL